LEALTSDIELHDDVRLEARLVFEVRARETQAPKALLLQAHRRGGVLRLDERRVQVADSGMSITALYVKVHQDTNDQSPTFVLGSLRDDLTVTFGPRG
jgi:hypothetical protein